MGAKARKRINISAPPELYADLEALRDSCGFRSVCALALAILSMAVRLARDGGMGRGSPPPTDEDYIAAMFDEYGDWERTPFNTTPPADRRTRKER